jgi:16S rRNA (guanine1207-N2)-methyltransferase
MVGKSVPVPEFPFDRLRRRPDVEAPNLFAVDAADRLILDTAADTVADTAADALATVGDGELTVIGDSYGALTLASAWRGARGIRVHQDALTGVRALAANARRLGLEGTFEDRPLDPTLVAGARVVLLRLPRSLDALAEISALIAEHAHPEVRVFAGGMVKHLTTAMNGVLGQVFGSVQASLARQKARVITATDARPAAAAALTAWPRREFDVPLGLWVCAHGAAFAGTSVDIGTRLLLSVLDDAMPEARTAIDLGCGTGVLATSLALRRPGIRVVATDQSAAAVASAAATAEANGVGERVMVVRDDGLAAQPDASAELIVLNPPFHIGSAVHTGIAHRMFADAARVLAPGGELWTVWNSHLGYRAALEHAVGPTRQIARNAKFTVTASRRPAAASAGGDRHGSGRDF